MDTQPEQVVTLTTVDRDVTDLAAMELADVLKEATAAGFGQEETLEAIDRAMQQYRGSVTAESDSSGSLDDVARSVSKARDAAMTYGNERIIYLLGLAMDEIKADTKARVT